HRSGSLFNLRSCGGRSPFRLHLQISARREDSMARRLDRRSHDRDLLCRREMGPRSLSRQRHSRLSVWSGEFLNHAPALDLLFLASCSSALNSPRFTPPVPAASSFRLNTSCAHSDGSVGGRAT